MSLIVFVPLKALLHRVEVTRLLQGALLVILDFRRDRKINKLLFVLA